MAEMNKDLFAALAGSVVMQLPRDLNEEAARCWINDPNALHGMLDRALRQGLPADVDPDASLDTFDLARVAHREFDIVIYPAQTIEQQRDAGAYYHFHPAYSSTIFGACRAVTGTAPVKAKVVAFCIGREATREQVKRVRDRLGLKPICIQHELAFGAQHKQAQRELNRIVNVDDVVLVDGHRYMSDLRSDSDDRRLMLLDADSKCNGNVWFLGLLNE